MSLELYPNQHPIFQGKIGCGMRLVRSHRTTKDPYRTRGAARRRALRALYRATYSRVRGARIWVKDRPSFKQWLALPDGGLT
jgi:hypothetical protein